MKKLILFAAGLFAALSVFAQEPVQDWARTNRYAADNA